MPVGAYAKPGDNADLQRNATVRSAATRPQRRPPRLAHPASWTRNLAAISPPRSSSATRPRSTSAAPACSPARSASRPSRRVRRTPTRAGAPADPRPIGSSRAPAPRCDRRSRGVGGGQWRLDHRAPLHCRHNRRADGVAALAAAALQRGAAHAPLPCARLALPRRRAQPGTPPRGSLHNPQNRLDTTTTHRLPASVLFRGRRGCACLMHSSSNTAPALRRAAASPQPRHHQLHAMPVHASPCTLQRATGLAARRRAYRCTRTRASSPSPSRSTTRASTRAAAPGSARSAWPSTRAPRGRRARTLVTARDPR